VVCGKDSKLLLSTGSDASVKKNAARAIANISVPTENLIPLMQSGVVEGLKVLLSTGSADMAKSMQLVALQISHSQLRI